MATLTKVLTKLESLNISITKESFGPTDFYYFSANGSNYEFSNQPSVNDIAEGFCKTFSEGSASVYKTFNAMVKSIKLGSDK